MKQLSIQVQEIRKLSRSMIRELGVLSNDCCGTSLTVSQTHSLIEIEAKTPLRQGVLAQILKLDKSTIARIVNKLKSDGLIQIETVEHDSRQKLLSLSEKGRRVVDKIHSMANSQVQAALSQMSGKEREETLLGLKNYNRALKLSSALQKYHIAKITKKDSPGVAQLIKTVMTEFGAGGPGFAIHDQEVANMFAAYRGPRSIYFVITKNDGTVVGGAGIAPLAGSGPEICELRKMYFMPEIRGLGLAQKLIELCLAAASEFGFTHCYLETFMTMKQAKILYEKNGFLPLKKPMGKTGHFACSDWYLKKL